MSVPLHTSSIYSLTWGDYGTSLVSAVQLLRVHGDLVDVTLAAGGRSFPAHKIVLCAASPFLLDLLKVRVYCQPFFSFYFFPFEKKYTSRFIYVNQIFLSYFGAKIATCIHIFYFKIIFNPNVWISLTHVKQQKSSYNLLKLIVWIYGKTTTRSFIINSAMMIFFMIFVFKIAFETWLFYNRCWHSKKWQNINRESTTDVNKQRSTKILLLSALYKFHETLTLKNCVCVCLLWMEKW